ncbi:hypothetical protein KEK_10683 [Mycolicibacterium thermoresistibile ATCC 19527]|uniref:Uncharacterized protein n=1 Tax=Mycolicibacterium thermoresistibile (strain ATCC 19527 / DSM 44167 / CIP 105390 / JCM 6362 / NCTC 10409 / 316) TaxID=1078020 RepID=G7CIM5_MYCT3|nr:hypothetical protein KEK_10683 [Mycolicibacterium thermoresistibile ATCC 19527]
MPVNPVRWSVVSAAVRPHNRPVTAPIPAVIASSIRASGFPACAGGDCSVSAGTAAVSAISWGSGRGSASPARMAVATADRIAWASSACRFQVGGGSRI